jgi:hypothetical protein
MDRLAPHSKMGMAFPKPPKGADMGVHGEVPEWLVKGRTVIIPKDSNNTGERTNLDQLHASTQHYVQNDRNPI